MSAWTNLATRTILTTFFCCNDGINVILAERLKERVFQGHVDQVNVQKC